MGAGLIGFFAFMNTANTNKMARTL